MRAGLAVPPGKKISVVLAGGLFGSVLPWHRHHTLTNLSPEEVDSKYQTADSEINLKAFKAI